MKMFITKVCKTCKKPYRVWPYQFKSKYCSHPCYIKKMNVRGNRNPAWKGGKTKHRDGCWMISVGNKKYVLEHRLLMEKYLKRKLKSVEVVHHINGNRGDNRIKNLELLSGQGEHVRIHKKKGSMRGKNWTGLKMSKAIRIKMSLAQKRRWKLIKQND